MPPTKPTHYHAPLTIGRPTHPPDDGPHLWHCYLGGVEAGPGFVLEASAELHAAALEAVVGPLLAPGERCAAVLASPALFDAVVGRCASPRSAALLMARYVASGVGGEGFEGEVTADGEGEQPPVPTLDRLVTGEGMAVTAGEE